MKATFFLGTHMPHWLTRPGLPLFVSRCRLHRLRGWKQGKILPSRRPWALDSGGFTELSKHGTWTVDPEAYVEEVRRCVSMGNLRWAAIQDWMCEPFITSQTYPGLPHRVAVQWHQAATVQSWVTLYELAPDLPWAPVLQGWRVEDYHACVDLYDATGTPWRDAPAIGVGTVCKRQATREAVQIFRSLANRGLRGKMHGFGLKRGGVGPAARYLASADSMAWSDQARRHFRQGGAPLCGPQATHGSCANCEVWAEAWRMQIRDEIESSIDELEGGALHQLDLWGYVA